MLTVLWKTPNGGEEIFVAPSITKVPAVAPGTENAEAYACHGRTHVALQALTDQGSDRMVIDMGEVFVMNAAGNTVATYRF